MLLCIAIFVCLTGCQSAQFYSTTSIVTLKFEALPGLPLIAVHPSFEVYDANCQSDTGTKCSGHRWEVWVSQGDLDCHVQKDLFQAGSSIGGGGSWIGARWEGEEADRIIEVLDRSRETYPYKGNYVVWPGPNSNTYAAWVLRAAEVSADLPPQAIGKDYHGIGGASVTTTGTGLQVETPILGLKIGLLDGIELHVLGFTFGIDFWPPALKTPFGRLGFPE